MSARALLVAAVVARLKPLPLTVFDAPPVRGGVPYAVVEEPVLEDWGAVGVTGRQGRIAVLLADEGERPVRLRGLLAAVEEAVPGVARALGSGWRVARVQWVRSRVSATAPQKWRAAAEFGVRLYREDA